MLSPGDVTADKPLEGRVILVVEDEVFIANALGLLLKGAGAKTVLTCASLQEAQATLEKVEFDAAVLDLRLPDGEGTILAKELISMGIGVVIHSGHADDRIADEYPEAAVCHKPASSDKLIETTRASIERTASAGARKRP